MLSQFVAVMQVDVLDTFVAQSTRTRLCLGVRAGSSKLQKVSSNKINNCVKKCSLFVLHKKHKLSVTQLFGKRTMNLNEIRRKLLSFDES